VLEPEPTRPSAMAPDDTRMTRWPRLQVNLAHPHGAKKTAETGQLCDWQPGVVPVGEGARELRRLRGRRAGALRALDPHRRASVLRSLQSDTKLSASQGWGTCRLAGSAQQFGGLRSSRRNSWGESIRLFGSLGAHKKNRKPKLISHLLLARRGPMRPVFTTRGPIGATSPEALSCAGNSTRVEISDQDPDQAMTFFPRGFT